MNKTVICASNANTNLFDENYRNSFTNYFPHSKFAFNQKMCLASIHIEKSFRTIGKNTTLFLLFNLETKFLGVILDNKLTWFYHSAPFNVLVSFTLHNITLHPKKFYYYLCISALFVYT